MMLVLRVLLDGNINIQIAKNTVQIILMELKVSVIYKYAGKQFQANESAITRHSFLYTWMKDV